MRKIIGLVLIGFLICFFSLYMGMRGTEEIYKDQIWHSCFDVLEECFHEQCPKCDGKSCTVDSFYGCWGNTTEMANELKCWDCEMMFEGCVRLYHRMGF